jgi:tetratricopeptide (TPR) repeat protein
VAVVRWFVLVLSLVFAVVASDLAAQTRSSFSNPAEYDAYMAALNTRDPEKRATAMEVFNAWYPASVLRTDAYEQAMAAWHAANQPAKAEIIAAKLLQADPDNVRALANRIYGARARAIQGDKAAMASMVEAAERGLAALAKWRKPAALTDDVFARTKQQLGGVFNGALGDAALQAKDYDKARRHYREAVTAEPDNLQDVYQLTVAQLEGTPLDALGFWYAPAGFVKSIPHALTPPEAALQVAEEHDPASLSFADWALVLSHRDASPANKAAADKVWKVIADKQQDGGTRLKIPVKVIRATPDIIEAAITDQAQAANIADLHITMARPLAPLPAVGAKIAIIGTLSDYHPQPFQFMMTQAELAEESLPVAGGACADPRPQVCTRDYRPACGQRRDGDRKTYGNACSACSDPEVVTQAAGACPQE